MKQGIKKYTMARINIETSLFTDARFFQLVLKLQSMDAALGALVRAWVLGQKWYTKGDRMIPREEWDKQELPSALIECGLAAIVNDRIKIRGADEQFAWLVQKIEAGRKGGNASRRPKKIEENKLERRLAHAKHTLAYAKPPSPSPFSEERNTEERTSYDTGNGVAPVLEKSLQGEKTKNAIGSLVTAWQTKFPGTRPHLGGKELGIIKRLTRDVGPERLSALWQCYLQMDDPWFRKKAFDLATFEQNIGKVSLALDRGKELSETEGTFERVARKMAQKEHEAKSLEEFRNELP